MGKARATDPATSHTAAIGERLPQKFFMLEAFAKSRKSLTADEALDIAIHMHKRPVTLNSYWKRISDLIEDGYLEALDISRKGKSGKYQRVLTITQDGKAYYKALKP